MRTIRVMESVGVTLAVIAAPATHGDVLWHNGEPDGVGGYSNSTEDLFGARCTLLDDFIVPEGELWVIDGFRHRSVYALGKTGIGTGMEIRLRDDDANRPGPVRLDFAVTHYEETATGRSYFSRDEAEHWTQFEPVHLEAGHYWMEATVVAPENNFWLTATQQLNECWVNYEDFGGLESGTDQFGAASDLSWWFEGTTVGACPADLNGNGDIDFGDLLLVLGAWGECFHHSGCPEDIDGSGAVDFGDILAVIGAWGGPCAPGITGACCFDDATCTDVTHAVCLSGGGRFLGLTTTCIDGCPGACCFDDGTCADGVGADECVSALGHFAGEATHCESVDCPLVPVGACCLDDGTCVEPTSEMNCAGRAGRYQGDGTSCVDNDCPVLGVCGWIIDAPFVWSDNSCLNDDSCGIRPSRDIQWEVRIPADGTWVFSLCGSRVDTYLFVDEDECCGNQHFDNVFCFPASQLTLELTGGQIVYVTLETRTPAECGEITLVVSSR